MAEPLIVFVCTANVCRSAWAQARALELLPGYRIASAGTVAMVGHGMDPTMSQTLPNGGEGAHRAQRLSRTLVREASVLLTMESSHRLFVVDEYSDAIRKTFTLGQFVATLREAPPMESFDDLVLWAYRNRLPNEPETEVPDPYGQGLAAARVTADQLETMLSELAGTLAAVGGNQW